ncbi:hypothetical protein [Bradyrhizobium sp. LB11.1]|uniref:hypothetical protein n=1 Tax=Bradyrhizobium sp. LB11.1 TaxID=3156326 RepID=UPI003391D036
MPVKSLLTINVVAALVLSLFFTSSARAQSGNDPVWANSAEGQALVPCKFITATVNIKRYVCIEMVSEAFALSQKFGTVPRERLVSQCEVSLAKRLPGRDGPSYHNACTDLLSLMNYDLVR